MVKSSLAKKTTQASMKSDNAKFDKELDSRQAWIIWVCAASFYLYECILRVSPSVMTQGLMHDFSATSAILGVLSSFYYYSYTPLQIPCGALVDYMGTRKIITVSAAVCALGAFIFAKSSILTGAQAGRFLIGAGSACAFISCLKVASEWFSPSRFAVIAGLTNMMGTFGGTFGGPPLAWMVNHGGWRHATLILAATGVAVTLLSWIMIRDHPRTIKTSHFQEMPLNKSLKLLITNSQVWLVALYGSLMWLPIAAFAELWSVPYLMQVYQIDNEYASLATVMIFAGFAVGSPIAAWVSEQYKSRLYAMKLSASTLFVIFSIIVFGPRIPLLAMFGLLFLAGICNGGQILTFACIKETSSKRISGTAVGFTNAIVMMSGIIFQPFLGEILDWLWEGTVDRQGVRLYSEAAYRSAILVIPAGIACAWILLHFVKETHHHHVHKTS